MYILLVYDIISDEEGARVSRNVFKICKKYLTNIQKSVFEGNLKKSELIKLEYELKNFIRKDKDSIIIFESRSENWVDKKFIGKKDDKTSNIF
ncbi:CRISPR-associated protein, Cas2 family [Anaerosphaera aminiphila DSM 21120]|uniref:CRISPR-associated endoribonuclease Cas2 n=1 Tax=Anaerosphaera aminiphila DSM 21120 TaxID=1120995 RepID=A0A1M5U4V4_9FIRM|nr:CRISPR-associated endonuclease Cas2 [Anaerosphaera aminiphila]SHH57910.1 CRISPR-associated protein, Cas2 family [Anaerosphaera aminiphila DSM 21120]